MVWKTSDGSTDVTFENWYPYEPTLGKDDQDCVVSDPLYDGQWYDTGCTSERGFICEFLE